MKKYQAVGIGNAIVDVISPASDAFLSDKGIDKGIMQLVDEARGVALYDAMSDRKQAAGGSVANTLAGLGELGLRTAFIGRVKDDELGRFYAQAMTEGGADFPNAPVAAGELPTSRSMIFVSPDGERSMNTYLGISSELGPDDVSDDVAGNTEVLFIEGYLYDKDQGMRAIERAAQLCRDAGGKAGVSLSDPFCVDRHRDAFRRLVKELDFVIGNEHEWAALYQCDLAEALDIAAKEIPLIACTQSGKDVLIRRGDELVSAPVTAVVPVDATGAGDQFAAGFIYGLVTGRDLKTAGRMGCVAAAEVIGHYGARPETEVKALFAENGLL